MNYMIDMAQYEVARAKQAEAAKKLASLSLREAEVVKLIAGGLTNKKIGRELNISHRTVEIHRANAFRKLGTNAHGSTKLSVEANIFVPEASDA